MKIQESALKDNVLEVIKIDEGVVYVFEEYIVTELNEGTTVDEDCFLKLYHILDSYSDGKENFGLISNRVHHYAVNCADYHKVSKLATRYYPTAFAIYTETMERSVSYEQKMYNTELPTFSDIEIAANWMTSGFQLAQSGSFNL